MKEPKKDNLYDAQSYSFPGETSPSASQWWRWPLMPVASIGGAVFGSMIVGGINRLGMMMNGASPDGWWIRFIEPIMVSGMFGYIWAYLAYAIPPFAKLISGVVMTTILGMLCLFTIVMAFNDVTLPTGDRVSTSIAAAATLVGAIGAILQCREDDDPYSKGY